MSYCRFSSDGFMCDVYVYKDTSGGWTTHVAATRLIERAPGYWWKGITKDEFKEVYDRYAKHMDTTERKSIGLCYDAQSFNDPTPGDCASRLEELKAMGYNVPQYAIDTLHKEEAECT